MDFSQVGKQLSEKEQAKVEFYQTLEKIEKLDWLEATLKDEKWSVWTQVWEQTRDWAQHKLNGIDPNNTNEIIRLQIMIDFYDNVLKRSVENYRQLGKEALEIAQEKGWLNRLGTYLRRDA